MPKYVVYLPKTEYSNYHQLVIFPCAKLISLWGLGLRQECACQIEITRPQILQAVQPQSVVTITPKPPDIALNLSHQRDKPCVCAFSHLASGFPCSQRLPIHRGHRAARRRYLAALTEKLPEEIRAILAIRGKIRFPLQAGAESCCIGAEKH